MGASAAGSSVGVIVRLAKVFEIMLSDIGLTMNQFRLLSLIEEDSPSPGELSERLVMKPPNVTAMVNGLEERGLMVRCRSKVDGRRSDLALTSAGRAYLKRANERCESALAELADKATGAKGPALVSSLQRWLPALDAAAVELRSLIDASESA